MDPLPPPDSFYLSAAVGWIDLGDPSEALAELDKIEAAHRTHASVLECRWAALAALRDWDAAADVAAKLVQLAPELPEGWLHQSYSVRRSREGGIEAAWRVLREAADKFPLEDLIAYNLACYACQMQRLDEARSWLRRAFAIGDKGRYQAMAMADEDLHPLWKEIEVM